MTLAVVCRADELPAVAGAWARRISAALEASFQGRVPVRWSMQRPPRSCDEDLVRPPMVLISVGPEGRVVGRVWLRWDPYAPERGLQLESLTPDASDDPPLVGRLLDALTVVFGLAGLVLWVWLVVLDWDRIWNRLSFSDSGDRATKLEIFLAATGWLFCPILTLLPVAALQGALGGPLARHEERRARSREDFVRSQLDPVVAAAVTAGCSAARSDAGTRVELGLGRPR